VNQLTPIIVRGGYVVRRLFGLLVQPTPSRYREDAAVEKRIAFALAGLGGFNAHGAGFLKAARDARVNPELVTATSGQIIVLAEWLRGTDLETLLVNRNQPPGLLGLLQVAMTGEQGVFRPAMREYWSRWLTPPTSLTEMWERMLPAQQCVPTRSKDYFQTVSKVLNSAPFGVVFNAYNLAAGNGVLFGNEKARRLLKDDPLRPITPDSVEAALWLSLYGFEHLPERMMDGAYHRPCVIAELHEFDRIYAVRPLARGWVGRAPKSWFDVQDWQCEMWFSVGYKAEVAELQRINDLIDKKVLNHPDYKRVELVEVAPHHPAGFFNYFIESADVYKAAYAESLTKLKRAEGSTVIRSLAHEKALAGVAQEMAGAD
jgi:hypothetical protein